MAEVHQMLEACRLSQYVELFDEQGYDDLDFMLMMSEAQVHGMCQAVGMKPGHAAKLTHNLSELRTKRAAANGGALCSGAS